MAAPEDTSAIQQDSRTLRYAKTATPELELRKDEPELYKQFLLTRAVVGLTGLLLPLVLVLGGLALAVSRQNSLSAYYYTRMGNYFVGSLFAIGAGLLVYMATRKNLFDNIASIIAGLAAMVVGLFPTNAEGKDATWFSAVHFGSAAVVMMLLAVMCFRFARVDAVRPDRGETQRRLWPLLHRILAFTIIAALLFAGFGALNERFWKLPLISWYLLLAEWVAVWAFAVSWALKGSEILSYYSGRSNKHLREPD